jgi:predicted dienelactone hydrolase
MRSTVWSRTNNAVEYDPFSRGRFPVGVRTTEALDTARNRLFPCEIWYPKGAEGRLPLILYSHHSGGNRRAATFLCDHLSSHGYVVAALDHSETIAAELRGMDGETAEQLSALVDAWIANRGSEQWWRSRPLGVPGQNRGLFRPS